MARLMIVTGAGHGIGAEIARQAAAAGYRVGVLDVNGGAAEETAQSLPDAVALVASTTDSDAIEAVLDDFGTPDALVNNAGIVRFTPLVDHLESDWRAVVDVNLNGPFVCGRAVARRLIAEGRSGSMVNISSINGIAPGPNSGAYSPTKAAVIQLTRQMAIEWGPAGIRVNSVAPGIIDDGMSAPILADPEVRATRSSRTPSQRLGTADDIAKAVMWLCSADAEYVNGHNMVVDGGVVHTVLSGMPRPASIDGIAEEG
ncbi:SDR family NAD(P)-dependent oxidoreductase [Candidatus Poriferisocius sp.]|uniref:SDR family NAD(P)-dependent oxidoreductase n=1 Tax=Candidatus Poriferisocius sp. TaxID=3101276 RepID=UPI003B01515E